MGKTLSKLKLKICRHRPVNGTGDSEAEDCGSRQITVVLPTGHKTQRRIFQLETAHDLLENCLGDQQVKQYDVVLCLPLKKLLVIGDGIEISEHWDDVHEIHIVPTGTVANSEADTSGLNGAIHFKT